MMICIGDLSDSNLFTRIQIIKFMFKNFAHCHDQYEISSNHKFPLKILLTVMISKKLVRIIVTVENFAYCHDQ